MITKRKRGRPPLNTTISDIDEVIGRSAYHLIRWGFPSGHHFSKKANVFDTLSDAASKMLNRNDSDGKKLGADRIEQLYEKWKAKQPFITPRNIYTRQSLKTFIPYKRASLDELAEMLLKNNGYISARSKSYHAFWDIKTIELYSVSSEGDTWIHFQDGTKFKKDDTPPEDEILSFDSNRELTEAASTNLSKLNFPRIKKRGN